MAEAGVEILCVGTELLLGDILNGNARWIAERLAGLGLPPYRQTVVGDHHQRVAAAASQASATNLWLPPLPSDLDRSAAKSCS